MQQKMPPELWKRVEELYHATLEREPSAREAFLREACGPNADLQREVESLLAVDATGDGFLESPAIEVAAQALARDPPGVLAGMIGQTVSQEPGETGGTLIGRYRLLQKIGEGGMGEVWKAHDTRLDRVVAIKQIKGAHSDRFTQEARAIAALNHTNICQIHDVGEGYLVLEYIEGKCLRGPLPLDEVLKLALQIASALEEAHARGILHRDLKPGNIMVTVKGAVKLLDFGLAKLLTAGTSSPTQTHEGMVLGTPAYMAPEQAQGKQLDERSDIFSFGAVLYEMLSGKPPFGGASTADVLSALIRDEPPPLSSPMAQVVIKCLAKLPEQRYQRVAEVRAALERISATPSIQASIAVLPFANMSSDKEQEYFSDGLTEEIINLLSQIPDLKVIARTSAFAFRGKEQDIRKIAEMLGVGTVLEGSVRRAGNRLRVTAQLISAEDGSHLFSERYDRQMVDVFAMQDEIAAAIAAALRTKLSLHRAEHTPSLPAYEALLKARYYFNKLTPDSMARGRECLAQASAIDPEYALPHCELAFHLSGQAFMGVLPAHEAMPVGRDAARRALELDPVRSAEALSLLGLIAAVYEYDWKEARRLFGLAIAHSQLSPMVRVCYGFYLTGIGQNAEAIEQMEQALIDDPLNLVLHLNLAMWLGIAGRHAETAKECRRILELDENYGFAWLTLSVANLRQGEMENALHAAEKTVALIPWSKGAQGSLAALLSITGDDGRAAEVLQKVGDGKTYGAPLGYCCYFMIRGEIDHAADWAARTIEQRAPMIINLLRGPLAEDLRRSPRWPELAKMMNLPAAG